MELTNAREFIESRKREDKKGEVIEKLWGITSERIGIFLYSILPNSDNKYEYPSCSVNQASTLSHAQNLVSQVLVESLKRETEKAIECYVCDLVGVAL